MRELIANALLYAVLLAAGGIAGITYESAQQAKADKAELQELQKRTARTTAWLRDARASSEASLHQRIATLQEQLTTHQGKADEDHQTHVAGVRSGTVSVRVPIVPASCPSLGMGATSSASAAPQATHAQLDPAAAADLAAIPHEGDAAIRELNTCIAQYQAVSTALKLWREKLKQMDVCYAQTH